MLGNARRSHPAPIDIDRKPHAVMLLLPPRQSRGASLGRLVEVNRLLACQMRVTLSELREARRLGMISVYAVGSKGGRRVRRSKCLEWAAAQRVWEACGIRI